MACEKYMYDEAQDKESHLCYSAVKIINAIGHRYFLRPLISNLLSQIFIYISVANNIPFSILLFKKKKSNQKITLFTKFQPKSFWLRPGSGIVAIVEYSFIYKI
jgi:hypothetical protein